MSVESRLRDALDLWEGSRREGALLQVLVAVAATSRFRYPTSVASRRDPKKSMGDAEAFETYFNEELPNIADVRSFSFFFEGQTRSLGWVLYKWFRCSLFHEGTLAAQVALVPPAFKGSFALTNHAGPPPRIELTDTLVILLADLVCRSKENVGLPPDLREGFIKHVTGT